MALFNNQKPPQIFKNDPYTMRFYNDLITRVSGNGQIAWSQISLDNATEIINSESHISASSAHGVTGNIVGSEDFPTDTVAGVVLKAATVVDAVASAVSIDSTDAGATYTTAEQALINELKFDVNQLATDLNAVTTQLNALMSAMRTAKQLT